jgi:hypothetical protein
MVEYWRSSANEKLKEEKFQEIFNTLSQRVEELHREIHQLKFQADKKDFELGLRKEAPVKEDFKDSDRLARLGKKNNPDTAFLLSRTLNYFKSFF